MEQDFHSTTSWVEINLHIHLKTTNDVVLNSMHTLNFKSNTIFDRCDDAHNTCQIKLTIGRTCIVRITEQIVHAVSIYLTRNELYNLLIGILMGDDTCYLFREIRCYFPKHSIDLSFRASDDTNGNRFMICIKYAFESMGESTMTNI